MKKPLSILWALIVSACNSNSGIDNNNCETSSKSSDSSVSLKALAKQAEENGKDWTMNPDTALAVFLYKNASVDNMVGHYDEYQRWVLECDNIMALIRNLYKNKPDLEENLAKLERKKQIIIQLSREEVEEIYNEFHGVSGPTFEFLCAIYDSTALALINKTIEDPRAPDDEKNYAREMKEMYFK